MDQISFLDAEYNHKKKKTRREIFLESMEQVVPWKRLEKRIKKYYASAATGRPPYPLSSMLRIHCMQHWYNMSDPAMEDALYEIHSMRKFAGLSLERIPDETTILNFRHLLEKHKLGEKIFREISKLLEEHGLILKEGTAVDATIISAPSSTKNSEGKRDPEMHQTKKGNQWHFGMKAHIGVDAETGVVHSMTTTPANHHDITEADKLLHGEEEDVFADSGYRGIEKRPEHQERKVNWHIAMMPGKRKQLDKESSQELLEQAKASIRAKVEHPFRIIKRQFGFTKTRYRGMKKNDNHLNTMFALANLYMCRHKLVS